jgi:hypothetical protein
VIVPDQFIQLAETTGMIIPIGRWVLEEECLQAAEWHRSGYTIGIAVNVSGRQLDSDELLEDVNEALGVSGLDPGTLTLEITETRLMDDPDAAAKRRASLKELGVRIAIDDFGTGLQLARLPPQVPGRRDQDRPLLHLGDCHLERVRSDRPEPDPARQDARARDPRRGDRGPDQLRRLQREQCDLGQASCSAARSTSGGSNSSSSRPPATSDLYRHRVRKFGRVAWATVGALTIRGGLSFQDFFRPSDLCLAARSTG